MHDADPARALAVAARFGIADRPATVSALLGLPGLDAVAVCTPPATHADVAEQVLAAGKHLFLEKPLAPSASDCDRIVRAAMHAGVRATVGFNLRQHRLLIRARARIQAGALGTLQLMRSSFTTDIRLRSALSAWRDRRHLGGGVLLELAVHHFDLWRWLTGREVEEVHAWSTGEDTDDSAAVATARLSGGLLATAQLSERTVVQNEIEILGDAGSVRCSLYDFDGLAFTPVAGSAGTVGRRLGALGRSALELPAAIRAASGGGDYLATFAAEWQQFAAAVLRGAPPAASLEDGRAATRIGLAASRSIETGLPVRPGDLD